MAARERPEKDDPTQPAMMPVSFSVSEMREILDFAEALRPRPLPTPSRPTEKVVAALVAAQAEYTTIQKTKTAVVRTKTGADYSFSYADLGDLVDMLRGPFKKHGLAHSHTIDPDKMLLTTWIHHTSGQFLRSSLPIQAGTSPQALGSSITYARRYTLSALAGAVSEEDDDGAAAGADRGQGQKTPQKRSCEASEAGPGPAEGRNATRKQAAKKKAARKKGAAKKEPTPEPGGEAKGNVQGFWMTVRKGGKALGMEDMAIEQWAREKIQSFGTESTKELSQKQLNEIMLAMAKMVKDNLPPDEREEDVGPPADLFDDGPPPEEN